MKGKVYLVGAGPGDPELLTRKAYRLLEQSEVLIYDRLISPEILSLVNPFATLIFAGKSQGQQDEVQSEIYRAFLRYADTVRTIVRLKSGDPSVFGRCGEELAFLNSHGIEAEIVPGISSALAAPALSGIPLTLRNVATSFAVIAGNRISIASIDWAAYRRIDTLIILMGVDNRIRIAESLLSAGRCSHEPAAFIERASTVHERVVETTLADMRAGRVHVEAPAIMIVGEVVRHRMIVSRDRPASENIHLPEPCRLDLLDYEMQYCGTGTPCSIVGESE